MLLVILGWVLFDTANLPTAFAYAANMFGAGGTPFIDSTAMYQISTYGITFIICIIGCTDLPKLAVEYLKKNFLCLSITAELPVLWECSLCAPHTL